MAESIAILGWGSLLWDRDAQFKWFYDQHGEWHPDGPRIPLEFSRISSTRDNALTLVIDHTNGSPCYVAYAISKRRDLHDAVCDLRTREGTIRSRIGSVRVSDSVDAEESPEAAAIQDWLRAKNIEAAIWTALGSNFHEKTGKTFTVENAVAHIRALTATGKVKAAEYVWRAPKCVETPARAALQAELPYQSSDGGNRCRFAPVQLVGLRHGGCGWRTARAAPSLVIHKHTGVAQPLH